MKLPNAEMAAIEQAKLVDYLLNVEHPCIRSESCP